MKLTGLLKDKVDAAATKEEKKSIIAEAGMELTDEELDDVAGGITKSATVIPFLCPRCNKSLNIDTTRSSFRCKYCQQDFTI